MVLHHNRLPELLTKLVGKQARQNIRRAASDKGDHETNGAIRIGLRKSSTRREAGGPDSCQKRASI